MIIFSYLTFIYVTILNLTVSMWNTPPLYFIFIFPASTFCFDSIMFSLQVLLYCTLYYSTLPLCTFFCSFPTYLFLYPLLLSFFLFISDLFVFVSSSSLLFSVRFPRICFCILFFSPIFCSPMMIETIRCQSSEFYWRKLIIHKLRAIFTENNEIYI